MYQAAGAVVLSGLLVVVFVSSVRVFRRDPLEVTAATRVQATAALGYNVDVAATGREGLRLAAAHQADVVVLDLGLPDIDGIDVIRGLRGWSTIPIVVLSVRDALGEGRRTSESRCSRRRGRRLRNQALRHGRAPRPASGSSSNCSFATPTSSSPRTSSSLRFGDPSTAAKPTTYASTSPAYATSSNPTRHNPATSSPSPGWDTASCTRRLTGFRSRLLVRLDRGATGEPTTGG